ncbi:protein sidekick-2 [Hyalella azteca]|uniref:Protein sidekick-2 n=1 Tax=Hyalella azteca TaxID=294128 RepID=A0A979FR69_HYAAZ|nr:protein sidekick-2 [Hyalella azteca]
MPHDPTFSSGRIQEGSKASKAPFTVVRGQYSKSELVNTQSLAHSYIYDPDMPIFDLDHSANVTGLLGKTAVLNCRVRNIGNKTVSWVRHRDIHLLTVGRFSYTSDQRFTARHADESEDWLLKIHYLQKRDAGWYECQISTTPPVSHMVYLTVVEPETSILGGPDVYINSGSRLVLTCSVKYSPDPPAFIFWYHNDRLVSYDHSDSGVQVVIEKGAVSTSRLLVKVAGTRHSGTYRCDPSNSGNQSVTVHVLEGEKPAAIQHENNSATASSPPSGACCALRTTIASFTLISVLVTAILR